MCSQHDTPQAEIADQDELRPEDLTDIDLADEEVIRVMVVKDSNGPRSGLPLLTGYESCATHDSPEDALEFINDLYQNPADALDDMDLGQPRDFKVKPRRDTPN